MRVVSCHGYRSSVVMVLETTYFCVRPTSAAKLLPDHGRPGGVRVGHPVLLVAEEGRASAEDQRVSAPQQLGVVLVERLVRPVLLVEVVEEPIERLVRRLVVAVQRLEVADDHFPHPVDDSR